MNGTKFYKLNKSNEQLLMFLQEEFDLIEENMLSRTTAELVSIAEIVFSAILTFFLEKDIKPFESLWTKIGVFQNNAQTNDMLKIVFSCAIIFCASILIIEITTRVVRFLLVSLHDNKSTGKDIYTLERIFYLKVLNEITTGLSLEKKSYELASAVAYNESETPIQDNNLSMLYLNESLYYFHEALHTIAESHMFEPGNPEREEYSNLLKELNPCLVCEVFDICISTLQRAKDRLQDKNDGAVQADHAIDLFEQYKRNVKEQISFIQQKEKELADTT